MSNSGIAAVLWDFGGVITTSPFDEFASYEREHGLPEGFIRGLNATNSDANAWAAFERGVVDLEGFVALFEEEARLAGGTIDARALIEGLRGSVIPEMAEAVRRCHRSFKTGLLTNNFTVGDGRRDHGGLLEEFDVILESSRAGCRKPDPRFYLTACDQLGIHPSEAVFLDDLGVNLKPARQLGMTTIKVVDHDQALADLEAVTGLALRDGDAPG
jgi:putative hydrolase of the HAD superfamily